MKRYTRGAKAVAKILLDRTAVLLSPLRRERSRQNKLAWIRTARSGARSMLVDSVAYAAAVRVVDGTGVEEDDSEAAARSRRVMERVTRGAEVVAKGFSGHAHSFSHHSGVSEAGEIN